MIEEQENIDWVDYWLVEHKKRTPEEIIEVEEKIKARLLKEAILFLKQNPDNNKTPGLLAKERWEEEYNLCDWQREEREEEYHESNISLLFTEVFNKLLEHSELLIKSSNEKAEVKNSCYTQFFERLTDQISDKYDSMPAISIPYDNIEGMRKLVQDIIIDIEPRLLDRGNIDEQYSIPIKSNKFENEQMHSFQNEKNTDGKISSEEIEIEASLKGIISKAQEMIAENSKGVKAFLQMELEELIEKYKGANFTYLSMVKRDFVKHYLWGDIQQLGRYKNFEIFWNNVFQKH